MQHWLPYIIQDETRKQEQKRDLENALRKILAGGEEERKTKEFGTGEDIVKNLFDPSLFSKLNLPAQQMLAQIVKVYPQLIQEKGLQIPPNLNQEIENSAKIALRAHANRLAGEFPEQDVGEAYSGYFGPEMMEKLVSGTSAVSEAAKERPIKERNVAVLEKGVPLEERKVAVSEGQLKARWKELAGQIGDMTAKEARTKISDLEVERRKYQVQLGMKQNEITGELYGPEHFNQTKSVIAEIKREEDELNSKFGKEVGAQYKALADGLKREKKYTAADLDTDEQLRSLLTEAGYNIQTLKKYMR